MARNHLDAMRLENADLYAKQILPETLKSLTPENRDFYDWQLKKDFRRKASADFKVRVAKLDAAKKPFLDEYLNYLVNPTHLAKVQFKDGAKRVTLFWQVVERSGDWYIVIPEPIEKG